MTINNLGNSLRDMGRLEESEKAYRESYNLMATAEPLSSRASMAVGNLGRALIRLGRTDEALEAIERAETVARRGKFKSNPLLPLDRGEIALLEGDFDEVRKQLDAFKATGIGSQATPSRDEAPSLAGRCAQMEGDKPAALKAYSDRYAYQIERARRTAESLVDVRLLEFANRPEAPAPTYLLSVLEPGQPADDARAHYAVWLARGVAPAVQMQRRRSASAKLDGLLKALNDKRQWLSAVVNSPFLDLATAQRIPHESAKLETLEERWALAAADSHPIVWRTPDDLAKRLPADVALVEYLRVKLPRPPKAKKGPWEFDDEYEAFVVRSDGAGKLKVVRKSLGSAREIDAAAIAFRNRCCPAFPIPVRVKFARGADPGRMLRSLTVKPLSDALAGAAVVVVAPDGMLHQVPWCALPGKEAGSYWGDDVVLASASSGPALLETLMLGPVETPKSALLVGGIKFEKSSPLVAMLFGGGRFGVLPATFQEVKDVAALLDDRKVDLQTGPMPDERRIRPLLPERRWLHFSTHGFFSPQVAHAGGGGLFANDAESRAARSSVAERHPLLFSGLVLANAGDVRLKIQENRPPYDNLLTAEEISGMRLEGVEMVVLSACGTAQGVVEYGEGASSLARAFHLAGVRTVVASRWPIYDSSSAAFAKRYFANLKAGKAKAVAMAEAQRWLRTNHPEWSTPDHWAPFVVSGDWR